MNWDFVEALPGLTALPVIWGENLGAQFPAFRSLCLQQEDWQAESYPCPLKCGCWHRVIQRHDGTGAVGACCCARPGCPDLVLSLADITPLRLNWTKLARELCGALGLRNKFVELPPRHTYQIGSWSAEAVPAILTIQNEYDELREVIAELGIRLRKSFLLFSPTNHLLTAPCHELLANAQAGFFALESIVILTERGTLLPVRAPGELFSRFTPAPAEDLDRDSARKAYALVKALDSETRASPTLLTVFREYCVENLSTAQIARKHGCSKLTVVRRLKLIQARTGTHPKMLRRLSPYLEEMREGLSHAKAARIRATHLIYDDEGDNSR